MTNAMSDASAEELVTAVLTASRVLIGISARSLDVVGQTVTVAQFRALVVLHSRGSTNLNGLAERLDVNASTALRMIDRLVTAKLVSRKGNPQNRREVLLSLTRAGAAVVDTVTDRRRQEIAAIVERMPNDRRGELVDALTAFADAADEPPAGAGQSAYGW